MSTNRAGTAEPSASPAAVPFVLGPFRGLRFNPDVAGDLGSVISPPYDVLDAETVRDLEEANHHNIVRLILSRRFERPYLAVRHRLELWRENGCLRPDPEAALYVYQYTADGVTVRGLIGAVGLRDESDGVILPHEDVMPEPVADRICLMRTTETNLEPILLVHEGTAGLRALLDRAAAAAPVEDFTAIDGSHHVLWSVTDPGALAALADELAATRALIADGHHRYAAYLSLREDMRDPAAPAGGSAWDYGLAMLVDQGDYPLRVGPIHRTVGALTIFDVRDHAAARGDLFEVCAGEVAAWTRRAELAVDADRAVFVVADGRTWAVLSTPRRHQVDAAVLHEELLPAWHIAEGQVSYHHGFDQALHAAERQTGVAVAVEPPTLAEVMASAQRGVRMPRKSTSFSPKPRMGLVMRDLRDA